MTMMKKCIFLAGSVLAFFAASIATAQESGQQDLPAAMQKVDRLSVHLRSHLNRTPFDLEASLDELNYEADEIVAFVRDHIAFEQYQGLLRGPRGTLMSQAGNALDQAVLLAKLLRDAGFDARVVRAKLDPDQAAALLRQMKTPRSAVPDLGDVGSAVTFLQENALLGTLSDADREALVTGIEVSPDIHAMPEYSEFEKTTSFLKSQLGDQLDTSADYSALLAEAADYFWVEFQGKTADPWTALHPVFASEPEFAGLQPTETFVDSIPEKLQHKLRLQLFIERRTGGKLETRAVSSAWERPIANLAALPYTFAALPDSALRPENFALSPEQTLNAATMFAPLMGGIQAPGGSYFDLSGNIIDPMAASSPAAGIFKEVGEAFSEAAGSLGGSEVVPVLTAVWLDIDLVSPDGDKRHYRRTLLDRIGPARRANNDLPPDMGRATAKELLPLLQVHTLIIATGRTPRGMAIDSALSGVVETQPSISTLIELASAGPDTPRKARPKPNPSAGSWPGHLALMTRFDLVESWSKVHRIYRHEPLIAIHSSGVGKVAEAMSRVDIVHNARRGIAIDRDIPAPDPAAVLAAGVWETLVEGSLLDMKVARNDTARVLRQAVENGIALRTILPGSTLPELPLTADAIYQLREDLGRGYALVVPEKEIPGLDHTGWWRVDPGSGVTLGLLDDGRGSTVTETVVVMAAVLGYGILKYQIYNCFANHNSGGGRQANNQLLCCVLANYAGYVGGAAIGIPLAGLYGEAIAAAIGMNIDVWADLQMGADDMICRAITGG